jgi:hypothetical protein
MDDLCCADGWAVLTALARQHGDEHVQMLGLTPELVALPVDAGEDAYGALRNDELWWSSTIRWWGVSGRWGIHGSRDIEIAVAGQADDARWPRSTKCDVMSIDAAIRLARQARVHDDLLDQMMTTYDGLSWDPAAGNESAVPELAAVCRAVLADRIDPVVAIRKIVDVMDAAPKQIRRIPATARLHAAWGRTGYLVVGSEREEFGRRYGLGLLAQNDRNHERHAGEERPVVRSAAEEIASAIERMK